MKVLVIGAGNMGLTYAEGMSKSDLLSNENIMILDTSDEKLKEISEISYFDAHKNLEDCIPNADIIFVAVKPFHAEGLLEKIKPLANPKQIVISVMAGVTIETITKSLGLSKVVRAMPNLPAKVGQGLTSFVASDEVSKEELYIVERLLATTGKAIKVANENFIDVSTAISGSGPAYVFYFMESMMEASQKMGFSEEVSKLLVSQTFTGAIELFNQSNLSPVTWMDRVASKGGTTRVALDSMDNNKVNKLIQEAAFAAYHRAIELGKEN